MNKIPIPPVSPSRTLHKSINFWSKTMVSLDKQFQFMEENFCFGKVAVEFRFQNGKMTGKGTTIVVNDRILQDEKKDSLDK